MGVKINISDSQDVTTEIDLSTKVYNLYLNDVSISNFEKKEYIYWNRKSLWNWRANIGRKITPSKSIFSFKFAVATQYGEIEFYSSWLFTIIKLDDRIIDRKLNLWNFKETITIKNHNIKIYTKYSWLTAELTEVLLIITYE